MCSSDLGMKLDSNQPDRKKGPGGRRYERRRVDVRGGQVHGNGGKESLALRQEGKRDLRNGNPVHTRCVVLCIGDHIDLGGATAAVVMMVVVRVVAMVVDGFTGDIAQHPDEMPAPVLMTGMDAEAHVCEDIRGCQQQAEESVGCLFHWCISKD